MIKLLKILDYININYIYLLLTGIKEFNNVVLFKCNNQPNLSLCPQNNIILFSLIKKLVGKTIIVLYV